MSLTQTPQKTNTKRAPVPLREFRLERQITGRFTNDKMRDANELTPCNVALTVLSGNELYNYVPAIRAWGWDFEYTRFVFDMSTLKFNKSLIIDWNHNAEQIIGSAEAPAINERGELTTRGSLVPFTPQDRAAEVAYKSQFVPYGISPTVAFEGADRIDVPIGESINVNGRKYTGPIAVFRSAEILGVSICPYPTDGGTNVATYARKKQILQYAKTLTKQRIYTMAKKGKYDDVTATDAAIEEVIEEVLADVLDEAATEVKNTELEDAAAPDEGEKPADETQLEDAAATDEEEKKKDEEKPASALRRLARALFSTEEPKKEEDEAELEDAAATDEEEKKKDENAQLKKVLKAALKTRLKKRLLTGLAKPRETPTIQTLQSEIADLTKIVAKLAAAKIAESGESHPASSAHGDAGKGYLAATTAKLERMVR